MQNFLRISCAVAIAGSANVAAAQAFNALINTPQGLAMIASGNVPPQLVAARAALSSMLTAIR